MPGAARGGDITRGVCDFDIDDCCPHSRSGICSGQSKTVFINGKPAIKAGDYGDCRCPHGGTFKISSGSSKVFVNGMPAAIIGSTTTCVMCGENGTIISGSSDVFFNG